MKKRYLVMTAVLCLCLPLMLNTSCSKKKVESIDEQISEKSSDVKLLSMKAKTSEKVSDVKKRKNAISTNSEEVSENQNLDYQYVVLQDDLQDFQVTINLENPNDYHILDFNLSCDDQNLKIYVNNEYALLSSQSSLNWLGSNNSSYILHFESSNDSFLTTLRITKLLYIDRADSNIKYNADISTNNEVSIYRVNSLKLNLDKDITEDGIGYTLESSDTHITNIKVNGVEKTLGKYYEKINQYDVTYDYELNDNIVYHSSISKWYVISLVLGFTNLNEFEDGRKLFKQYKSNYDGEVTYLFKNNDKVVYEGTTSDKVIDIDECYDYVEITINGCKFIISNENNFMGSFAE